MLFVICVVHVIRRGLYQPSPGHLLFVLLLGLFTFIQVGLSTFIFYHYYNILAYRKNVNIQTCNVESLKVFDELVEL